MKKEYLTKGFYKERDSSLRSAEIIVPVVLELFNPKSIVDFGCGTGEFINFANEYVTDVIEEK